jgi:hypothetical protein
VKTATDIHPPKNEGVEKHDQSPPPNGDGRGHGGQLTKVTVNLVPRSVAALEDAAAITNDTKTDTINRALQLWAWCQRMIDSGSSLRVVTPEGKELEIQLF